MRERKFGTIEQYEQLQDLLTVERMGSYFDAAAGDLSRAFKLYEWNMSASAAIMHTTGMVEVLVRNALDQSITAWTERKAPEFDWLDFSVLDGRARKDVMEARRRASQRNGNPSHGKVVAELSFGFWRYLAASRYLTTLWIPAAQYAFPHGCEDPRQRRIELESGLKRLHLVRNRAAHHEPIHRRDLIRDLETGAQIAGWINPVASDWVLARSALRSIVSIKPQ